MAGENITLVSPRNVRSIDYVWDSDTDGKRGDYLPMPVGVVTTGRGGTNNRTPNLTNGFLLSDVTKGETVAVCIEADLVEIPKPIDETWIPGEWIYRRLKADNSEIDFHEDGANIGQVNLSHSTARTNYALIVPGDKIGIVHNHAELEDERGYIIWLGDGK